MIDDQIPNSGQPQQINLNKIAQQFMLSVQRHFDMLAFNLAAHDTVQEDAYNKRVNASHAMPSPANHQNLEQLQAYARDLLVRHIINDSLNLTLAAMNNAHFFLTLIKATGANKKIDPQAQRKAQASQQNFIRTQLDEKFNRLEKDYGVTCELEDSIVSLAFILQILVKQNKVVRKEQLDQNGELVLELKSSETPKDKPPVVPPLQKLVDIRKVYSEGDIISFDDIELQLILVTIASFADSLFKSVARYARSAEQDM